MQLHIENMTCGGCARTVTNAIKSVDPAAEIETDPPSRRVDIRSEKPGEVFLPALEEAGYPATAQ